MEYFQDVIRGPYPFLLVAQILIISGLLLLLLWIAIQRLLGMEAGEVLESIPSSASIADAKTVTPVEIPVVQPVTEVVSLAIGEPMAPDPNPVAGPSVEAVPIASGLTPSSGVSAEEVSRRDEEIRTLNEESDGLRDKVKYLESRLMEYEIVQEEISNLSTLRVENEKLKEELLKATGGKPEAVPTTTTTTTTPTATSPPPNPVLEAVSEVQIDTILKKLDDLSAGPKKS